MLRTRVITAIFLVPIVLGCIHQGGLLFLAVVTLLLTLAEVEFCHLVARAGFRPTVVFGTALVWIFLLDAYRPAWELLQPAMALIVLGSLAWQLLHRQGSPIADWALTVAGGLYVGLCGACLIRLRGVHDGAWWTLTAIPSIMLADSGAYFVGRAWGRRKLAPTLSPGKTWEGYLAGIVIGALLTALFAAIWSIGAGTGTTLNALHGLIMGLVIAVVAPLGDLAVSMIKRQVGVKDSSSIIPGHGGALDRVDSILWAAVIGYYYVHLLSLG